MSRRNKPADDSAPQKPAVEFLPPLNPRRTLFFVLAGTFVVWVMTLLTLYFATVYPLQHPRESGDSASLENRAATKR